MERSAEVGLQFDGTVVVGPRAERVAHDPLEVATIAERRGVRRGQRDSPVEVGEGLGMGALLREQEAPLHEGHRVGRGQFDGPAGVADAAVEIAAAALAVGTQVPESPTRGFRGQLLVEQPHGPGQVLGSQAAFDLLQHLEVLRVGDWWLLAARFRLEQGGDQGEVGGRAREHGGRYSCVPPVGHPRGLDRWREATWLGTVAS